MESGNIGSEGQFHPKDATHVLEQNSQHGTTSSFSTQSASTPAHTAKGLPTQGEGYKEIALSSGAVAGRFVNEAHARVKSRGIGS